MERSIRAKKWEVLEIWPHSVFIRPKNLGCLGDGGALTTNTSDYSKKAKMIRNYGLEKNIIMNIRVLTRVLMKYKLLFLELN
jgi:dTDP-4-amino-4,6-dideoxygalactose transaminase